MYGPFERETLLDLTVNLVPLAVMLFFVVLFVVINPWGVRSFTFLLSLFLLAIPIVLLTLLTYVSGRVIQRDEASEST